MAADDSKGGDLDKNKVLSDAPQMVIKSYFRRFCNNEERIGHKEFKELVYSLGYHLSNEEVAAALKLLDKDFSGDIDMEEFVEWWERDPRFSVLHPRSDEQLAVLNQCVKYFEYFDKDRSGSIDRQEFVLLYGQLVQNYPGKVHSSMEEALKTLDNDGNGHIELNEYMRWLTKEQIVDVGALLSEHRRDSSKKLSS